MSTPPPADPRRSESERQQVEREIEELGDPESAPSIPAGALAAQGVVSSQAPPRKGSNRITGTEILTLAWPVMGAAMLMNISGLVDRMMIARVDSPEGAAVPLAAVGFATQFFFLIQSTLFAVGLACVALMARAIGARDPLRARTALAASLQVSLGATVLLMIATGSLARPALTLLGAEPIVIEVALPYLYLLVGSSLLLAASLIFDSALRANKNTRSPMVVALVVAVVKLGGNWVLIFGALGSPALGVVGAGLATVISQFVGLAIFVWLVRRAPRESPISMRFRDVLAPNPLRREVIRIAMPGIAERIVMNFGLLAFFWVLSNSYGTVAVAAYTLGVPLLAFSWIPGQGYAQAGATLVGQCLGAGKPEEATRTGWVSSGLALATAVVLGALCLLFADSLALIFTDDAEVVGALVPFLVALAICQPFLQLHFTLGGAHRGAGDTWTPLVAASVGNWVFRVPLACAFALWLETDLVWVWYAMLVDHAWRALHLGWSFRRGRWRDAMGRSPA